jgi:alpha-N-arabinofuranosidase
MRATWLGIAATLFAKAGGAAAMLGSQLVAARWLGVADFGSFSVLLALAMLVSHVCSAGFPFASIRFLPGYAALGDWAAWRGFLWLCLLVLLGGALLGVLVLLVLLPMMAPTAAVGPVIPACILLATLLTLSAAAQALMQVQGRSALGEFLGNGARAVMTMLALGLCWLMAEPSIAVALMTMALGAGLSVGALAITLLRDAPAPLRGPRDITQRRDWFSTGFAFMFTAGVSALMERIDLLVLSQLRPPEEVGAYAVASRLALLVAFAVSASGTVLAPRIAAALAQGDDAALRRSCAAGAAAAAFIALICGGVLLLFGDKVLGFFGEGFALAAPALYALVLGQTWVALLGPAAAVLLLSGHNALVGRVMVVALGVNIAAALLLVPLVGMLGAAIATGLGGTVAAGLSAATLWRSRGLDVTLLGAFRHLRVSRGPGLAASALAMLLGLSLTGAASAMPVNGDFTQGGDPPAGWSLEADIAPKGALAVVQLPGATGPLLELRPNARNTPGPRPFAIGQAWPATGYRGREVTVTASLGAEGGAAAVLGLVALRRDGRPAASAFLRATEPLAATALTESFTLADDPAITQFILFLAVEGTAGVARFAGIQVTTSGAVPPPAPRASAARVPEIAARLTVDTQQVARRIPRGLFGANIEVIRDANGLWDRARNRLDPQLVALARELRLDSIRFPGGVWGDAYDWRLGVGPRAARRPAPNAPGDRETHANQFGTQEALDFAQAVGGHLFLSANVGTGDAALAAEWVRHVNGEGGRHRQVPIWEIGNESYLAGDLAGAHMPAERYAERVLEYAAAMRAVDPGIRIAAIGLRNFGRYQLNAFANWNEVVLRRAGHVIDVFAVHNGYAPLLTDTSAPDIERVYAALHAFPEQMARNLRDTAGEIARFAPEHAGRIRLGVTEWGPLFAVNPANPWIDHAKTLGSAVFVADVLRVMAQDPSTDVAHFFKLNETSFTGWLRRHGSGWITTPPAMAFGLVSRGMEPMLLASRMEAPTYASPTIGHVAGERGIPYVTGMASAAEDGQAATALLINRHPRAAAMVEVALAGLAGIGRAELRVLTGPALDAHTGAALPVVPGLRWAAQQGTGPRGRMREGSPDEVRIETAEVVIETVNGVPVARVRVPPHSVGLLRVEQLRR